MLARLVKSGEEIILIYEGGDVFSMNDQKVRDFFLGADLLTKENAGKHPNIKLLNNESDSFSLLAFVDENYRLVITDMPYFRSVMSKPVEYLTAEEYAELHGKKRGIVMKLCRDRRLAGAVKKGEVWLIPSNCPYPKDARLGSRVESL